jgi:hypothetical protein
MIKHKTEWSFTDQPDVFRICRELREAGCPLGLATRADGQITLVDGRDRGLALRFTKIPESERFHVFGSWYCVKGDRVAELLKVSPVTVRGYKPSASGL